MRKKISRREFVRQSAGGVVAIGATIYMGAGIGEAFGKTKASTAIPTSVGEQKIAAQSEETAFFEPHEYALVAALSGIIIPTDDFYPGAVEVDTANFIDKHLSKADAKEQSIYRNGLKWLDQVSKDLYEKGFLDLSGSDQLALVNRIDRMLDVHTMKARGLGQRIKRKTIRTWYEVFDILDRNVVFFKVLHKHVIYAFYTNPASWVEIGYFGPPQPVGYLDYFNPPTPDSYTGKVRPVENGSCLICHPKGTHPRGGLINHTCQKCHRPHSPWVYDHDDFHVEDHLELAFPNLDRRKRD